MKVNKYNVTEEKNKVTVTIEVCETLDKNPIKDRKFYSTEDVRNFLKKKGHKKLGTVIKSSKVSNFQGKKAATGTWIFLTSTQKKSATKPVIKPAIKPAIKPVEATPAKVSRAPSHSTTKVKKVNKRKSRTPQGA